MIKIVPAALALALLTGCGTVERLWSGPREISRLRPGVVDYRCDANRSLALRFDAAERSAWVLLPDREFRLDSVAGAEGTRYSNGRSTLSVKGEEVLLEEGATATHSNCKRVQG